MNNLASLSIKLYRPTRVYFHRVQVIYFFKGSDYVYRTFKIFFNSIRKFLRTGEVSGPLRGYSAQFLKEWELYDNKVIAGRRYRFGIRNSRTGLMMFTRGPLDEDKPLTIYFHGWLLSEGDNPFVSFGSDSNNNVQLGPEPVVVQISKRWDKETKKLLGTAVAVFFTGDPRKNWDIKIIEYLFSIMYRFIDWRTAAERRLIRVEQFIRIPAVYKGRKLEEEFMRLLDDIELRYALPTDDTSHKHRKKEDLIYEDHEGNRRHVDKVDRAIDLRFKTGYRVDLKIYRKKKFKLPEEHYTDHPKIEVVHYNIKWEDLNAVLLEGAKILASVAEAMGIVDVLILDPDHPISAEVPGDVFLVASFRKLAVRSIIEILPPFLRSQMHETRLKLLEQLLHGNLKSADLKRFEKEWGIPVRTLRYHMKKLADAGLVVSFKTANNQYIYILNTEALSASAPLNVGEKSEERQLDFGEAEIKAAMAEFERRIKNIQKKENVFKTYLLIRNGINTSKAISKILGVSTRQVRNYIHELLDAGLIVRRSLGRARIYVPADYESVLRTSTEVLGAEDSEDQQHGGVWIGAGFKKR